MTISERIVGLQSELGLINREMQKWNDARLRTEGAITYLQKMEAEASVEETVVEEGRDKVADTEN